jgi:hypothetical protein
VGDATRTEALWGWMAQLTMVLVIWLLGWPVWVTARAPERQGARRG